MEMKEKLDNATQEKVAVEKTTSSAQVKKAVVPKATKKAVESEKSTVKPTKKTATTTKKTTTTRKTAVKKEIFIQFYDNQVEEETLTKRILAACKEQKITVKDLKMYLKPEENACYYVVNKNIAGKVDLF